MLFIFRKIRRSFFLPGKVRTYLAYAVGEIILIVVGILIAVQIGDWKEEAKVGRQRQTLIENLKVDFQTNLERLEYAIATAETASASMKKFLSVAAGGGRPYSVVELRELSRLVPIMFRPSLGAYQSAISDGSIGLIKHPRLIELFVDFEQNFNYYLINQDMDRESNIKGEAMPIRRQLGSFEVLIDRDNIDVIPDAYALSDSDYRELIAQKDIYAYFEMIYDTKLNQKDRLLDARNISEQILATLKSL